MVYETFNSTSTLDRYLTIIKSGLHPQWKYFLRAETFYTMAKAFSEYDDNNPSIFNQSHGEAFNEIFSRFSPNGLYLMDEPESALSPKSQMQLLSKIHFLAKNSQFIIVTHSPLLLSYIDGQILDADNNLKPIAYKDTENYSIYRRFLECPEICKSIYLTISFIDHSQLRLTAKYRLFAFLRHANSNSTAETANCFLLISKR